MRNFRMANHDAYVLRENTGTSGVLETAHVIELIQRRQLPRDVAIASAVRKLYEETWDALQAER